jgi:gliding motility-associated-like protein
LVATTSQSNIACFGNSTGSVIVSVSGGIPGYTYLWNNNVVTPLLTSISAGNYSVVVTDANNCTVTASTTLTQPALAVSVGLTVTDNVCFGGATGAVDANVLGGTAPYQYVWSNQFQTQDISGLPAGTYTLTTTDANGCALTSSATVTQPNQLSTAGSQLTGVSCFGGSDGAIGINPSGGTPGYSYTWSNGQNVEDINNLTAGNYNLTVTDANNCSNTFSFTVPQPTLLTVSYLAIEPLCFGYSNGQLIGTATGGIQPYAYSWSNGVNAPVNTNLPTGTYSLTITDANGCQAFVNAFLDQPEQIQVSYNVSDTLGCDPFTVQFTNTSVEQYACLWSFGDGTFNTDCNAVHTFETPGCFDVELTVTSALGCANSVTYSDIVCVLPSPTAGIEADPPLLDTSDPSTNITNVSNGAVSYLWDMGDGSSPYTFFQPGMYTYPLYQLDEYTVTLMVTAENGCTDTDTLTIYLDNDLLIYVPNAFTPDDDYYNQTFRPIIASIIDQYHLIIFDRWGEILFESYDKNVGWDGTYGGNKVQDGTYTWQIIVSTNGTYKISKSGHVSVIR